MEGSEADRGAIVESVVLLEHFRGLSRVAPTLQADLPAQLRNSRSPSGTSCTRRAKPRLHACGGPRSAGPSRAQTRWWTAGARTWLSSLDDLRVMFTICSLSGYSDVVPMP
jgi:hypothetical protein